MAQQFVVVKLMGRLGNQFYQLATAVAYAKRHGFQYFATSTAENCDDNAYYFKNFPQRDMGGSIYQEKIDDQGYAYYADIPNIPNVFLIGYSVSSQRKCWTPYAWRGRFMAWRLAVRWLN
jgi:hypothetical protein